MKKKIILAVVLLAMAGAVAWRFLHHRDFLYAGTVEATDVDLTPQVSAVISTVTVREGDPVKKGQVLVAMAGEDYKLAAQMAARDYKRAVALHRSGSMSDEAFDKLRYKHEDAALRVSWLTLTAPIDGTVTHRYREPGELVNSSMKLLTVADLQDVWAYVYVPQTLLAKLRLGMAVDGYLPELGMKRLPGRVAFIRPEAEFTPKNVQTRDQRTRLVYGVKVAFDNSEGLLKPGMTVEVRLPEDGK